ncbi:UNVERIFIED_CONTAM: hypothetical protein Sradi_1847000 [Sesamum radiatum]|uniref:Retrovirus-related Pol polyprotein from transposon TNT 1-94-like beta-barrel domain-containing protein n=1 Tax=Sesamum radiatum TaxID=300843 RepID=A0AAW2U042_SESRA
MIKVMLNVMHVDEQDTTLGSVNLNFMKRQTLPSIRKKKVTPFYFFQKKGTIENDVTWYLDNGASNHMTGDKNKFVHIDTKVTGDVRFGDDTKVEIEGKGTVILATKNGDHKLLHDVYYIPKMKNNILSIGQLMENGQSEDGGQVSMASRP